MKESYRKRIEIARSKSTEYRKLAAQLKKKKVRDLDVNIKEWHHEAFDCTDCLECANCCKTTGPKFNEKDIDRISAYLKMKASDFIARYLQSDDEGDRVLQRLPCPFLASDNYCSIYEVRPHACADYPHTTHRKMNKHLALLQKNTLICPAAALIFQRIEEKYG